MALLSLKNITVAYGKNIVLKNLNLEVEQGELISLLGPSGCGKTTTLRLVGGFIQAREGQFIFNGKDYTNIPVHKRNFGFVFQSYALFPHLTVFNNVAFGLKQRNVPEKEIKKRVMDILEIVDLKDYSHRLPKELSGGQKQRVALARALVIKPDLLLLDEPLSNLDAKLRVKMRLEIRKIQQQFNITTIYVTHDQEECFSISDRVAVMNEGIIEQLDSPQKIYTFPKTEFVANFVGFENFIELELQSMEGETGLYKLKNGKTFRITCLNGRMGEKKVTGAIRPEDIKIITEGGGMGGNTLEGIIGISTFLGKNYQYVVETEAGRLLVSDSARKRYQQGERVSLYFPEDKIVLV